MAKTRKVASFLIRFRTSSLENSRVAVVVGKKVNKLAVVRNQLRRQVLHSIYQYSLSTSTPFDLVIIVLPDILHSDITQQLTQLNSKISTL